MDSHKLKYHVKLRSGRDFILKSSYDPEEIEELMEELL